MTFVRTVGHLRLNGFKTASRLISLKRCHWGALLCTCSLYSWSEASCRCIFVIGKVKDVPETLSKFQLITVFTARSAADAAGVQFDNDAHLHSDNFFEGGADRWWACKTDMRRAGPE